MESQGFGIWLFDLKEQVRDSMTYMSPLLSAPQEVSKAVDQGQNPEDRSE